MSGTQKVLSASEPWAEYQLEDGTLLRFRLTACNFRKTGKTTDQGDPEYSFSQQVQCETIARTQLASLRLLHPAVDTTPCEYSAPVEDAG